MANPFAGHSASLSGPAIDHYAVVPHDSTNFTTPFRALHIGTGGDVSVVSPAGNAVTYRNLPNGARLDAMGVRVNSTGTTATDIVAMV